MLSIQKTPTWMRGLQIVMGAICIGMSALVMINPLFAVELVVIYLSISLFMIGISSITMGAAFPKMRGLDRAMNIGIGVISIGVSAVMITAPAFALSIAMFLFMFALFSHAFGWLQSGIANKKVSKGMRAWNIAVGIISVALLIGILFMPGAMEIALVWYVSITLLINGMAMITRGVEGKTLVLKPDIAKN